MSLPSPQIAQTAPAIFPSLLKPPPLPKPLLASPEPAPIAPPPPICVIHIAIGNMINKATCSSISSAMSHVFKYKSTIKLSPSVSLVEDSYRWSVSDSLDIALSREICEYFRNSVVHKVGRPVVSSGVPPVGWSIDDSLVLALLKAFSYNLWNTVRCPIYESNFDNVKHAHIDWSCASAASINDAMCESICRSIRIAKWHAVGCPIDGSILRVSLPPLISTCPLTTPSVQTSSHKPTNHRIWLLAGIFVVYVICLSFSSVTTVSPRNRFCVVWNGTNCILLFLTIILYRLHLNRTPIAATSVVVVLPPHLLRRQPRHPHR
jgi:hypothetical protein